MKDKNIEFYFLDEDLDGVGFYVDSVYRKFCSTCIDVPDRDEGVDGRIILRRNGIFPEDAMRYILSKDRRYLPAFVSCCNRPDYSLVENILKEERGEEYFLDNSIFARMLNNREILKK